MLLLKRKTSGMRTSFIQKEDALVHSTEDSKTNLFCTIVFEPAAAASSFKYEFFSVFKPASSAGVLLVQYDAFAIYEAGILSDVNQFRPFVQERFDRGQLLDVFHPLS